MKVLAFHQGGDFYGSDRIFLTVCSELAKQGFEIKSYVDFHGELCRKLVDVGVESNVVKLGVLRKKEVLRPFSFLVGLIAAFFNVSRIFFESRGQFDVVYVNTLVLPLPLFVAKLFGRKTLSHVHETLNKGLMASVLYSWCLFFSDRVVCVSAAVESAIRRSTPWFLHKKILVIHNGIESSGLVRVCDMQGFNIIYVGRISPGKGLDFLLDALDLFSHDDARSWSLSVVGSAFPGYECYEEVIKKRLSSLSFSGKSEFYGYVENARKLISDSDLLVLPSSSPDSFPTVVLEAMAEGTPVLVTDSGGASEMISNEVTGLIVPPGSATELYLAIKNVYENRVLAEQRAVCAKKVFLREFSVSSFGRKMSAAIKGLLHA